MAAPSGRLLRRLSVTKNKVLPTIINKQPYHTTCILYKRSLKESKPKAKLEGDALAVHMKLKLEGLARFTSYKQAVNEVVQIFKYEKRLDDEKRLSSQGEFQKSLDLDKEALSRRLEIIGKSNEELKVKRSEREKHADKLRLKKERIRNLMTEEEDQRSREKRQLMVAQAMVDSIDFITIDNLDSKIELCLLRETNYNFALARDGERMYSDRAPGNVEGEWQGPGSAAFKLGGRYSSSAMDS